MAHVVLPREHRSPSGHMTTMAKPLATLPILIIYVLLCYLVMGTLYLLAHPGLLVKWAFALLDVIPKYGEVVLAALMTAFQEELQARFR